MVKRTLMLLSWHPWKVPMSRGHWWLPLGWKGMILHHGWKGLCALVVWLLLVLVLVVEWKWSAQAYCVGPLEGLLQLKQGLLSSAFRG